MKLALIVITFAVLFETYLKCNVDSATVDPILTISQGKLKGKLDVTRNGRNFVQYLGIPYVKKPERFQIGGEAPTWDGIRDATKYGSPCPQFDRKSKSVIGNEDCNFINIFTPEIGGQTKSGVKAKLRPVIVHLHGGSFVSQSSDLFGPNYFLDEDVVLVTFNYRLSVLGFLSTGDKETIANLGLRDALQALKYVQQNIEAFGGDASRVTLFGGGSAGGALASYLTFSPLSKGMFSGVITTSGNSLCPWTVVHNPAKIASKLATKLNCPNTKTSKDIVTCLKGKSVKDIEIARVALQGFAEDPAIPFAPVVESWLAKDLFATPVIPDQPEKLMSSGNFVQVPWLTGINSLNGINLGVASIATTPKRLTQLDQEWNKLAPITFHYSQTAPNPQNVSEQIREHYFGTKNISIDTRDKLISALTDRNFIHCTAKAASIQSKFIPVYLYMLNYVGASSFLDDWGLRDKINVKGVVHGDELQHLFNLKLGNFPVLKKGDKHYAFSDKMVKLWITFAQNGKPMELIENAGAEWSPVPANTPKSKLQWYTLDSVSLSRPTIFDESKMSKLWDQLDFGQPGSAPLDKNNKFAVGYEFPLLQTTAKPSPIASKSGSVTPKPTPTTPNIQSGQSLLPLYSPTPSTGTTAKTQVQAIQNAKASTPKPVVTPVPLDVQGPSVISAVFKDEDPYSSTTTTTKKPGFFQKLIG